MEFKKYDKLPSMIPMIYEDEIERLNAEIERLREALRKIGEGDVCVSLTSMPPQCARAFQARAALKEKE